jgi:hypothetical protein
MRIQPVRLDHGAHSAIQNEDALLEQAMENGGTIVSHETKNPAAGADGLLIAPRALATFVKRPQAAIKSARFVVD